MDHFKRARTKLLLQKSWVKISSMSKSVLYDETIFWANHVVSSHSICLWPRRILSIFFAYNRRMTLQEIREVIHFYLGNGLSTTCAGTWILLRLAVKMGPTRDKIAQRSIKHIYKMSKLAERHGTLMNYYDIEHRKPRLLEYRL